MQAAPFAPTPQQMACVQALGVETELKIEACAGSGKTSTLKLLARAYPVPSMYLCFNKQTSTEATASFPENVECRTSHSVAFGFVGADLQHKLKRPEGRYQNVAMTGSEIAQFFRIDPMVFDGDINLSGAFIGMLARKTVQSFEQSADKDLNIRHVPHTDLSEKLHDNVMNMAQAKKAILKIANKLWAERTKSSSPVLMTPDTYLKLYQLSKPLLRGKKVGQPQILYVDEFQDTTPCVLDIILNQRGHMKIVMVGDDRQAIYGWRGAVNAMQMVQCAVRPLTKSFRYGQAIADIATTVLERDMVIQGNESIKSVAGSALVPDSPRVKRSKPYTRLFRTNAALLTEAIADIKKGRSVNIEIDVKDFVKFLQSANALFKGDKKGVKHDAMLAFSDWDEALAEAKHDPTLGRVCKVIKDGLVEDWIDTLQHHENVYEPHVTYTTAHKSKGREWSQVIVENDFKSCYDEDGEWKGLSIEEQNLLYVALTRAIDVLEYNNTILEYINYEIAGGGVSPSQAMTQLFGDQWRKDRDFDINERIAA